MCGRGVVRCGSDETLVTTTHLASTDTQAKEVDNADAHYSGTASVGLCQGAWQKGRARQILFGDTERRGVALAELNI